MVEKEIDWDKLWKLPDDLKGKVVKGKTPKTKVEGDISEFIARALVRLDTHDEMRTIIKQVHSSTTYKEFNRAITAYKNSSKDIKEKICSGEIHILDLIKEDKKPNLLSKQDRENWVRYKNAMEVKNKLDVFYKDLKFFMQGNPEDRKYLTKFLKADKILYIASVLSCIRDEELWENFLKHQGIRDEL